VVDVGRGGGEDRGGEGVIGSPAGGADAVEPDRHEIGEAPHADPSRVRPAEAVVPAGRAGLEQRRHGVVAAHQRRQALVEFGRAQLLEQIDHGVGVAPHGDRYPGIPPGGRVADAVGQIAFGGRADAHGRSVHLQQPDVVFGEVCRVYGGERSIEGVALGEQFERCERERLDALMVLGRLFAHVGVQRRLVLVRPPRDLFDRGGIDGPDRVDRCADADDR
jgi:hypothetical protein